MKPERTLLILLIFAFHVLPAQTQWTKYTGNPVLVKGPSNWDIVGIGQPTCLIENDTIKMWYVGVGPDMKARICYAFSIDGINWTKYNGGIPVIDVGIQGEWDSGWLDAPEIVKGPGGYFLYYYGDTIQQTPEISSAYGLATSTDGINWTKYPGNPVFTKGDSTEWDGKWVESPAIIYDSTVSLYKMWYTGVNFTNWLVRIGYAISPDGINWTKYSGNPVLDVGTGGSFDDMWVAVPAVLKRNTTYEMWYSTLSSVSGFDTIRIGYASSSDGINWAKYPNSLFSTFSPPYDSLIDDSGPWAPDVIYDADSNIYKMWFETEGGFLLATSLLSVGVTEIQYNFAGSIQIFPNPTSGSFTIQIKDENEERMKGAEIKIYDIVGKEVHQSFLTGSEMKITPELQSGIYFLKVTADNFSVTKKIVRQ